MVPKVIKEEGQTPPPPPVQTLPPPPPGPPLQCVPGQGQCIEMQRRCGMVWCCDSTVGWGSEHRAAFSCCEGMCSRAAWYAGLSHNTWLCVKRRCIRCLLSRPSEGLLAVQVLDGLLRWGRAAGDGCVEVHRQWAVAGNTRLLLWCRCWYRGTHVGAVVVLCIQSEEAVARCDLAVCVLLHVWSAGESIGHEGCASLCTALEQNKTLTSFTLAGMLCSGVCSVQVIGVLWCKCSGAVITGRSFSRLPFGSGHCGLHYGIWHCSGVPGPCHLPRLPTLLQRFCPLPPSPHTQTYAGCQRIWMCCHSAYKLRAFAFEGDVL